MSVRSLVLASVAVFTVGISAHAATFDFMTVAANTTPTFSITSGGITATFSSPTGNGFTVQNTAGAFTFATGLVDENYSEDPLTITFSAPVSGTILIPFGIEDIFSSSGPDSLTVTANTGQTASFAGISNSLFLQEPEGVASFVATAPVTSLTLNGTTSFAIGNVSTAVAATPEPTSLVLLGTGLAGLWMRRRRG